MYYIKAMIKINKINQNQQIERGLNAKLAGYENSLRPRSEAEAKKESSKNLGRTEISSTETL